MRLNRRTLIALAVTAVAIPAAGAVIPTAHAAGPDLLPLTVTNDSGRGEQVHRYILGVSGDRLGYVTDFLDLHFGEFRPFYIFNVADAAISMAVIGAYQRAGPMPPAMMDPPGP